MDGFFEWSYCISVVSFAYEAMTESEKMLDVCLRCSTSQSRPSQRQNTVHDIVIANTKVTIPLLI